MFIKSVSQIFTWAHKHICI